MHRLPDRARLHVLRLKKFYQPIALAAVLKKHNREPVVLAFDLRQKLQASSLGATSVEFTHALFGFKDFIHLRKLREPDSGEEIAHSEIVTDLLMLVPKRLLATLLGKLFNMVGKTLIIG